MKTNIDVSNITATRFQNLYYTCVWAHVWRSGDSLKEAVLSYHVGLESWIGVSSLATNTFTCWTISPGPVRY